MNSTSKNKYLIITLIIIVAAPTASIAFEKLTSDHSVRKEFSESGKLLSETNCLDENDSGFYKEYYENGNLKKVVHYKDGDLEGSYADYCEDGTPHVQFQYRNNKRDGKYTLYYENGNLQAEGEYENGKEQGPHKVYYPNGQLAAEVNYIDGLEDGTAKTYYKDGKIWEEFSYKMGKRDGKYLEYAPEEYIKKEIEYKNDAVVKARNFDENRNMFLEISGSQNTAVENTPAHLDSDNLRRCVSEEIGIAFACNPNWDLSRKGKMLTIIINETPYVELVIEETEANVHFMHELSHDALKSLNRYEDGFNIERINHCDRETVKVNGYLKGYPEVRVSDFYLQDHQHLHTVRFTVNPKQAWEEYKWLIKDVIDSLSFVQHKADIKFIVEATDETCEDLVVEK